MSVDKLMYVQSIIGYGFSTKNYSIKNGSIDETFFDATILVIFHGKILPFFRINCAEVNWDEIKSGKFPSVKTVNGKNLKPICSGEKLLIRTTV
jgi:hypothetical protein